MKGSYRLLLFLAMIVGVVRPANAHVGNKDVFEQVSAGPYKLYVTIRPPTVVPGVAAIEVRALGGVVRSIQITPIPLTGEASKHPPAADTMKASSVDPAYFTGSLWLMASGSWQVRFQIEGAAGEATASVPVAAAALSILPMDRPLGVMLGALGVILILGMAGIVAAAVREARLKPGVVPTATRNQSGLRASLATVVLLGVLLFGGGLWWHVEAAGFRAAIYKPLVMRPTLQDGVLDLSIASYDPNPLQRWKSRLNSDLLLDHGHVMHLYAIRQPGMDAVFHLHPNQVAPGELRMTLPSMPAGEYKLYGDVVHASGFPETLTADFTVPVTMHGGALDAEDASAMPPSLSGGQLGPAYTLPDGYTMVWDQTKMPKLTASRGYTFRFRLLDPAGRPATGMQPYLGMAGHAAFVKADGTTFAHTHPDGSAAMAAVMLADASTADATGGHAGMMSSDLAIGPEVEFPYGFPSAGRYRMFIQMKHDAIVETGVFDAEVQK